MTGWYAAEDHEDFPRCPGGPFKWRPYLDFDNGAVRSTLAIRSWFHTRAECEDFIKQHIIGKGFRG